MKLSRSLQKSVASILILAFGFLSLIVAPAKAAMVGTDDMLQAQGHDLARQKVKIFLERQEVVQQLHALGVDPDEAKLRVDAMTDAEIAMVSKKIDQLPAGGDALGFILLVGVVVFIVLVITDIMGVTDVFTFIKKK
ncbi:MAG: PA2779 family protein [Desulfobacteraceae bacterium]|nr:PA2779 family protein [Desulfobacteraceae bacterium]